MDWFRSWHDMPTDPKWRVISRKTKQRIGDVIAIWNLMMVNASSNDEERGTLRNWSDEDVAAALDLSPEDVNCIRIAMEGKVLDGDRLTGWEKRQPKREREDPNAIERAKSWRERQRTPREHHVTPTNANERLDKSREEKRREEENNIPPNPIEPIKFPTPIRSESVDSWDFADWAEKRYEKHPKKANRILSLLALSERFANDPVERAVFEKNHDAFCETKEWKTKPQYVTPLADKRGGGWISDDEWKHPPIREDPEETQNPKLKMRDAMDFSEELEQRAALLAKRKPTQQTLRTV